MPTGKILEKTVEEVMSGYQPIYAPLYGLFLGSARQHVAEVGQVVQRQMSAVGDIRAHRILPKDTEIKQVNVSEGNKTFAKYYFANQYIISHLQDRSGSEDVIAEVLDEHNKQMDELLMLGGGTVPGDVVNNGLYLSSDPNYTLSGSVEIASTDRLSDFHTKVLSTTTLADDVAGRKLILFYGTDIIPLYNSIYSQSNRSWRAVAQEVLGDNYSLAKIPSEATPSGANGWIVVNMDQIRLHYTILPRLDDQGENREKKYDWYNFLMGSAMVEVRQKNGIIRQPATLAA